MEGPTTGPQAPDLRDRHDDGALLAAIVDAADDAIMSIGLDGTILTWNAAAERLYGYSAAEICGRPVRDLLPADLRPELAAIQARLQRGERIRQLETRRLHKSGREIDVSITLSPIRGADGRVAGVAGIARDIGRRKEAEELSTLLEVGRNVASQLEFAPLVGSILEQLKTVMEYTGASIATLDGGVTTLLDSWGPGGREAPAVGLSVSLLPAGRAIWERLQRHKAVLCPDVRGDTEIARAYRAVLSDYLESSAFRYVRSWLAAPLVARGRVIGLLSLSRDLPNQYSERHAGLALAVAGQIAVALENARLFEEAQEVTRRTAALAEIGASVALAGSLETILSRLAKSVTKPTGAVASAVLLLEGEPVNERIVGTYGLAEGWPAAYEQAARRGARSISLLSLREGRPVVQRNARQVVLELPEWEPIHALMRGVEWDTYVSVPLVARGRQLGTLAICYPAGEKPNDADLAFLTAVADQAAIAVDNARLFAEAQGKAALEERQRLARELHDSVSQALYGIALGARTARSLAERDPARLAEPLDYVLSLAEAGLAEMRALIFELRPESLATEGLVAALGRQATLLRARHRLMVDADLGEEPEAALEAKEAVYRIGQEALQNVVKHARATSVAIRLTADATQLCLHIRDDGQGFDPSAGFPGHLGLRSMRERAERLGGRLQIQSEPSAGTLLEAAVPREPAAAHAG